VSCITPLSGPKIAVQLECCNGREPMGTGQIE
jgi:hypothetical protein